VSPLTQGLRYRTACDGVIQWLPNVLTCVSLTRVHGLPIHGRSKTVSDWVARGHPLRESATPLPDSRCSMYVMTLH